MVQDILPRLQAGERGTVSSINTHSDAAKRLADLGFMRGARVQMIKPGSPCIVCVEGTTVGLGAAHQANIRLEPFSPTT